MRGSIVFLFVTSVTVPLLAQSPPSSANREPRSWREAERNADDVRSLQQREAAAKKLHTPQFRDALRSYAPDKVPASNSTLTATWGEFVTADGTEFFSLQLGAAPAYVKPDAKVVAFGEVVAPDGKTLYDFEEPVRVQQSKNDLFIERSFILPSNKGTGTFGIASGNEILAMTRVDFDGEELTKTTAGISRVFLSDNIYVMPTMSKPLDPFTFGGTKVIPKPDRAFKKTDEVWYFTELRNPAVDEQKQPKVTAKVELEGNGKKVRSSPTPVDALPLKGVAGHYGIGSTIDVSRLPAGEYKLRVTISDALAQKSWTREEMIRVLD